MLKYLSLVLAVGFLASTAPAVAAVNCGAYCAKRCATAGSRSYCENYCMNQCYQKYH